MGGYGVAAGFRLMHGLAFAALLGQLGLGLCNLVIDLLGFNLGIELTQLMVAALLMPSLTLLSRTRDYPPVRTALAGAGIVLAAAWLAERTTFDRGQPPQRRDGRPGGPTRFTVAAVLTVTAAAAWAVPAVRPPTTTPTEPTPTKVPSPL